MEFSQPKGIYQQIADQMRDRILAGQPLADVATEVGFFDQAHLTHRFRRFLGVTPGRFPAG